MRKVELLYAGARKVELLYAGARKVEPVSYTHLDVYKRQIFGNVAIRKREVQYLDSFEI